MQDSSIQKYEIHCAKRYLDYTENEFFRAFRDPSNPECYAFNYAVLKQTLNAGETFAHVERFFAGTGAVPKFYSKADGVTLLQARGALERHGYEVLPVQEVLMTLCGQRHPGLRVLPLATRVCTALETQQEAALVQEYSGGQPFALPMVQKQLAAGARAFFAYNNAGVPVSYCLGEGYGSAFYLSDVYTPPACRRQGCATAVVDAALRWATEAGFSTIFLYTDTPAARTLYERLGFRGTPHTGYVAFLGGVPAWMKQG